MRPCSSPVPALIRPITHFNLAGNNLFSLLNIFTSIFQKVTFHCFVSFCTNTAGGNSIGYLLTHSTLHPRLYSWVPAVNFGTSAPRHEVLTLADIAPDVGC